MNLRLNQVVFGLGRAVLGATDNRMGVWTQGCSLPKCPGCTSMHTWFSEDGKIIEIDTLLKLAVKQTTAPSGLTISGGEPTDQADGVLSLIFGFRSLFPNTESVLYTGLRWPTLVDRFPALVAQLDVAICGPYVHTREATPLTGSCNQEVKLLTPLAEELYCGWQDWPQHTIQIGCIHPSQMVTVGIPDSLRLHRAAQFVNAVAVSCKQNVRNDDNE